MAKDIKKNKKSVPSRGPRKKVTKLPKLERIRRWSRSSSIWPIFFGPSCCSLQSMFFSSAYYNRGKTVARINHFPPEHADLLIISGAITKKMLPGLMDVYDRMSHPRLVMSVGSCTLTGGIFKSYNVIEDLSAHIPIDVYVPGCPPVPEAFLDGLKKIRKFIRDGSEVIE